MCVVYDGFALFCYPPALAATKACATDRVTAHFQKETEARLHSEMNAAGDSGDSVLSQLCAGSGASHLTSSVQKKSSIFPCFLVSF